MRIVTPVILATFLLGACGSEEEETGPTTDVQLTDPNPPSGQPGGPGPTDPMMPGGPGGGQTGPSVDAKAAEQACTSLAQSHCARLRACAPGLYPMLRVDDATCISTTAKRCLLDQRATGSRLDATGTTACATALSAAACEDVIADRLPAACRPAGSLDAGKPCGTGLQCQSGFCAGASDAGACGICAPPVQAGGACLAGKCPSGLSCRSNVCVASKKLGEACSATSQCGIGQVCDGHVCATARAAGELCALDADCNWLDGLYCSFGTSRCTKVSIAAVGESCGPSSQGDTKACAAAGECGGAELCIARPKETEACSANGPKCSPGLACLAGACAAFDPGSCK